MRHHVTALVLMCTFAVSAVGCGGPSAPATPAPVAPPKIDPKAKRLEKAKETGYTVGEWTLILGDDLTKTFVDPARPYRVMPQYRVVERLDGRQEKVKLFLGDKPPKDLNSSQAWLAHLGFARAVVLTKFGQDYVLMRITAGEQASYPLERVGKTLPRISKIKARATRLAE